LPGVSDLRVEETHVRFDAEPGALDAALRRLTEAGVRSLISRPPTLEELFMRHYRIEETGEEAADGGREGAAR
jgi:ABC-2 type transport system ATP-binding protein